MPTVLSTEAAAKRLGGPVHGLANWHRVQLQRADGNTLDVIGVPALHGPEGSGSLVGEVTGFVLAGPGLPRMYVSGDNASLDRVREIAKRLGRLTWRCSSWVPRRPRSSRPHS